MGVHPDRNAKRPGQAEVRQLDHALIVYEEVLRLQVPVENPATVAEVNPLQDLVQVALSGGERGSHQDPGSPERPMGRPKQGGVPRIIRTTPVFYQELRFH